MKRTSFRLMSALDESKDFVDLHLPTFVENNQVEIIEENDGYTVYVKYDECDATMKELEECFMKVFMLDDYLDAWNIIQDYSDNLN